MSIPAHDPTPRPTVMVVRHFEGCEELGLCPDGDVARLAGYMTVQQMLDWFKYFRKEKICVWSAEVFDES